MSTSGLVDSVVIIKIGIDFFCVSRDFIVLYLITGKSFYREAYLDMHMAKAHHSTHSKVNKTSLFWVALSKCVECG